MRPFTTVVRRSCSRTFGRLALEERLMDDEVVLKSGSVGEIVEGEREAVLWIPDPTERRGDLWVEKVSERKPKSAGYRK
jgi:hypothetical protein